MKKSPIALICAVLMAVSLTSSNAWAVGFRSACTFSGQAFPSSGPAVPFAGVVTLFSHWNTAGTIKYDAGSLAINVQGLFCAYTLETAVASTAVVSPDGSGKATLTWKPVAANPSSCQPEYTGHAAIALTNDGFVLVGMDAGETQSGVCYNQNQ